MRSDTHDTDCDYTAVDQLMERVRSLCLGLAMPMEMVLPAHLRDQVVSVKSAQLAAQIVFSLADNSAPDPAALQRAGLWLYDACYFLLTSCNPEDCILQNILKICTTEQGVRDILMEKVHPCTSPIRFDLKFPLPPEDLERALSQLAFLHDSKQTAKLFVEKLDGFCQFGLRLYFQ